MMIMATSIMCFNPPTKVVYRLCKTCGKRVQLGFELSIVNFIAFTTSLLQPSTISLTLSCSQKNLKHQNIIFIIWWCLHLFHLEYMISTNRKDFCENMTLIHQITKHLRWITKILKYFLTNRKNIKGLKNSFSYLFYSQIWLNFLLNPNLARSKLLNLT
jgi:hypothetical protein